MQGRQHLACDKMQQGSEMRCSYWLIIVLLTIYNCGVDKRNMFCENGLLSST